MNYVGILAHFEDKVKLAPEPFSFQLSVVSNQRSVSISKVGIASTARSYRRVADTHYRFK